MARRVWALVLLFALVATPALSVGAASTHDVNGLVVFSSNGEIYVMRQDGSNQTRLTHNSFPDFHPAWSPDGSKIAFASTRGPTSDIFVINSDGTGEVQLTDADGFDRRPSWSPDGTKILFDTTRIPGGIYVMNADGSEETRLAGGAAAQWSPDGSKIVYSGPSPSFTNTDIWMMNADGSSQVNITNNDATAESHPTWSPNGGEIAYVRDETGLGDIWKMRSSGSASVQLTNSPAADTEPVWSPDGNMIMFTTFRDGNSEIYVMLADGSNESNVSNHLGTDSDADWARSLDMVGLVDPASGAWHLSSPLETSLFFYGNPGDVPFMGDWDCDGVDTPGLFRLSDAFAYLRNANSQGIADIRFFFGNPSDIPLAGDFDGDGCDSLSLYRPSEQRFYIINALGANEGGLGPAEFSFLFGDPGDKPFVGDFDGDGVDEVGLHRESTGFVYYRNTLDTGTASNEFFFGDPGDRFVAGDWGIVDGTDTPGLFRPATTTFFFRHTNSQGTADNQFIFGQPSWLPVAGIFGID
ncbi:MAG: DUF5050 domain-containing protein [Acidimicrobiia bacterium]